MQNQRIRVWIALNMWVENWPQLLSLLATSSSPPYIWVWVNTYRYIFSGMNIHLPAILGFTRYQGFDPSPYPYRPEFRAGFKVRLALATTRPGTSCWRSPSPIPCTAASSAIDNAWRFMMRFNQWSTMVHHGPPWSAILMHFVSFLCLFNTPKSPVHLLRNRFCHALCLGNCLQSS